MAQVESRRLPGAMRRMGPRRPDGMTSAGGGMFDAGVLIAILVLLSILYWSAMNSIYQVTLLSTFLLVNGLLSLIGLIISFRTGSTLFMITFYFNIVFLSAAPLQQIGYAWRPIYLEEDVTLTAAGLCIASTMIGLGALALRHLRAERPGTGPWSRSLLLRIRSVGASDLSRLLMVLLPLSLFFVAIYNVSLLTTREQFGASSGRLFPRELSIVVTTVIHPFIFLSAASGLLLAVRTGKRGLVVGFGLAFLMAALIYNPLIQARFRLSAMIVFFALVLYGWQSARALFTFVVAGTAVSPVLNSFRSLDRAEEIRTVANFFVHMDYDAFTMICYIIKYVMKEGVDYGLSALSAFLYFVPRAIWSGKSEHVAKIIFDFIFAESEAGTDNLSTPPVAEGFFAFGAMGAILASVLYFWLILRIERRAAAAQPFSPAVLVASISPMFLFILLRGPLIVGVSELSGAILALVLCMWVIGAFGRMPQGNHGPRGSRMRGLGRGGLAAPGHRAGPRGLEGRRP